MFVQGRLVKRPAGQCNSKQQATVCKPAAAPAPRGLLQDAISLRAATTTQAGKGFGDPVKIARQQKPKNFKQQEESVPEPCLCGSSKAYKNCCGPQHSGATAATSAEAVLRARFTAYCQGNVDYLLSTSHPDLHSVQFNVPSGQGTEQLREQITNACSQYEYAGLRVLETLPSDKEDQAVVSYEYLSRKKGSDGGWDRTAERDTFVLVDGQWQFVDYQTATYPSMDGLLQNALATDIQPAPAQLAAGQA